MEITWRLLGAAEGAVCMIVVVHTGGGDIIHQRVYSSENHLR